MAGKSCNDLEEPETSSVTVKNGCSEVGGYDCDFVESPADDLLCKICHYPARDPRQTNECCGQIFCAMCLDKYMESKILDNKQCPYCKTVPFTFMRDARTKRYVGSLKVFCPHKSLGCTWTGELRSLEEHLVKDIDNKRGCPFTELQCSNGCGVVMQRRLVEGHLKSECELREVKCEYCNTTGSYQWINSSHHEECPKYPVECPNHCEVGHVRREEIRGHLEECPLAIVECPYAAVGCESVVRRREEMEHVMGSVGQHMEYNKNVILANQNRLDVEEQELESVKQDLRAKEQELEDIKRDLQATKNRLDTKEQAMVSINKDLQDTKDKLEQSQEMQSQLKTTITEKGMELDEVRKNAEEKIKALQVIQGEFQKRLNGKEQEMEKVKRNLQATRDRLDTKTEQAMIETKEKLEQSQFQLKTTITEKGRELDEVRKNAEESKKALQKMIQQLKDKLEGTEQSLQHQLKVNTQLQLQVEIIFKFTNFHWPLQLNYLTNSGNEVVPVIIKLAEFKKYKNNQYVVSAEFYTRDGGYKMYLHIYPSGYLGSRHYVTVIVYLMKGDHDDHLTWPVKGTLTVQLLNQLSDDNHSKPVKFHFDGYGSKCQRAMEGILKSMYHGIWIHQFIHHDGLSYDADKKCQYLKDDCVFFRVCNFQ